MGAYFAPRAPHYGRITVDYGPFPSILATVDPLKCSEIDRYLPKTDPKLSPEWSQIDPKLVPNLPYYSPLRSITAITAYYGYYGLLRSITIVLQSITVALRSITVVLQSYYGVLRP